MDTVERLIEVLTKGQAVLIVGTGVSTSAARVRTYCSWLGLLDAGVEYVVRNGLAAEQNVVDNIKSDIDVGKTGDPTTLLTAADKLIRRMGGIDSTNYANYLRDTVGSLQLKSGGSDVIDALLELGAPIVTTNYDTLLEQASQRSSVTWRESARFRAAVAAESTEIAHLHGIWSDPGSIVFGSADYGRITSDDSTTAIRQGLFTLKTLIFVGFGAGLDDPHFDHVRKWINDTFPGSTTNYQLCRSNDLALLATQNRKDSIVPVAYGDDYDDLPIFLKSISPLKNSALSESRQQLSISMPQLAAACRRNLYDKIVDTSVMLSVRKLQTLSSDRIDDLLIAPILLPVPPDVFDIERTRSDTKLSRLDPHVEVMKDQSILLTGDEHSGVTATLQWMVIKRSEATGAIPIMLDYLTLQKGQRPAQNAIRKYLRAVQAPLKDADPLPENIIVAIDNVTDSNSQLLKRLVADLVSLNISLLVIGCHTGNELRIQEEFELHEASIVPIYLGKVTRLEAELIATKFEPLQAKTVADRALSIAGREKLARTPLYVTLLIVGISNADSWVTAVSNTSFLDAFVDSLLGRGDPRDDARLQIDAAGHSLVLEYVAEKFIANDSASIDHIELLAFLGETLGKLDWEDRPEDVLRSLVAKGILVDRNNIVRFRQSAYLHIFAARRLVHKPALREFIRRRPLYYGAIIGHYAALRRDDADLLNWAYDLLEAADNLPAPSTGIFGDRDEDSIVAGAKRLEKLAAALDLVDAEENVGPDKEPDSESEITEYDPYDAMYDPDREPFPSPSIETAPLHVRINGLIALVSNVIRDSEMVEEPELKQRVLERVLRVWGQFLHIISSEEYFISQLTGIIDAIIAETDMEESQAERFRTSLMELWPLFVTKSGVDSELGTIKLARALRRITDQEVSSQPVHLVLAAALLERNLVTKQWVKYLRQVWETYGNIKVIRTMAVVLTRVEYMAAPDGPFAAELEELLVDVQCADAKRLGAASERRVRGQYRSILQRDRVLYMSKRLSRKRLRQVEGSSHDGDIKA